ncbi:PDF receptor-like [Penaeus monodon]|uniref:PDF receptor-like n=1 Tax=Penaeus monodon TaxID=6687 RepID=UPI0018A70444|nr:PDF receptor-like [Penaeus monodon]
MTAAWAGVTATHFGNSRCWWGYNFTAYFWILEGPRLSVISLNMIFLLNIIRVLVTKLRQSNSSEALQVRKAVKAAIVLLPLLGITNVLNMIATPLSRSVVEFGLWSYATHFLTSFQGFFIALLYCFLNGEVRAAVRKLRRQLPPASLGWGPAWVWAVFRVSYDRHRPPAGARREGRGTLFARSQPPPGKPVPDAWFIGGILDPPDWLSNA